MSMRTEWRCVESTAAGILTAETNWNAGFHQAGEGEGFGHAVVHGAFDPAPISSALFQQFSSPSDECESRPGM